MMMGYLNSKMKSLIMSQQQNFLHDEQQYGIFCHQVFQNPVILSNIFGWLTLEPLQTCRLVCRLWAGEVRSQMTYPKIDIHLKLQTRRSHPAPQSIQLFPQSKQGVRGTGAVTVTKYLIPGHPIITPPPLLLHTLSISLIKPPCWFHDIRFKDHESDTAAYQDALFYEYPRGNVPHVRDLIHDYLSISGSNIRELRLELYLRTQEDALYLTSILTACPTLTRLALDLVRVEEEGLNFLMKDVPSALSVQELALRAPWSLSTSTSLDRMAQLLRTFPNLTFLDLTSFFQFKPVHNSRACTNAVLKCLVERGDECCPDLRGIRLQLDDEDETMGLQIWSQLRQLSSSRRLSSLFLNIFEGTWDSRQTCLREAQTLLQVSAGTLITLDLALTCFVGTAPVTTRVSLPPNFPLLKYLSISAMGRLEEEGWTPEKMDFCNLKHWLLRDNNDSMFKLAPALTHLSIVLNEEEGHQFWDYILPPMEGDFVSFPQIKVLNTTLMLDDCCDPKVMKKGSPPPPPIMTRILSLFPNLVVFRHTVRKMEEEVWGCEHRRDSNSKHIFDLNDLLPQQWYCCSRDPELFARSRCHFGMRHSWKGNPCFYI